MACEVYRPRPWTDEQLIPVGRFFQKVIRQQGIGAVWLCGDGPPAPTCSRCGSLSERLCDYPLGDGKTCDLPLCWECAVEQMPAYETAESIDYCPQHALIAQGLVTLHA